MVSSIDLSTRLTATKLALKAIREQEDNSAATSSSSSRSSLLGTYGVDTSSSSTNTRLTQLLAQYAQSSSEETASETTEQTSSGDITQAGFMKDLKAMLEDLSKDPAKASQAKAMLDALAAGTLTVSDPSEGAQVLAWDVKSDSKTTSKPATEIATTGWSDFLKDHLKARRIGLCQDRQRRLCRQHFRRQRIFRQRRQPLLLSDLATAEDRHADGVSHHIRPV